MTTEDQELSKSIFKSISQSINKKGAIGLMILLVAGSVGLFGFYSNTNRAIESGLMERTSFKSSINNIAILVEDNQIGVLENKHAIKSVQVTLDRVIELQLLILEKIE